MLLGLPDPLVRGMDPEPFLIKVLSGRKESDPDTLVTGTDQDPHQNVTDPQHW